ncbi:class I SAM-dependent methyltransferase [Desulfosporosinus nitroreducens]|uniref:class I SAM-dependent methyltransferase n=1 Tax=Desulfosporosinus nitroreducens TaxID=2018668 RepID=UPI00207C6B84|nr:class I SAM-dependent methyltransferase [Desulfosporosinus nitroreducens]MCO1603782.1 class I SAM-dependent methyltransferase [Desulfosporosinus nitroreducens]
MLTLDDLINADRCPAPYEPGEELWNDPHISKMMLEAHLSTDTDAASYMPEKIQEICEFLARTMVLKSGDSIVDLGCGPGLYCSRLVQKGFYLTGIDRSESSICYARNQNHDKHANYILASYLNPFGSNQFDAALMISQDYGVLSPENRKILLSNIRNALKPNGYFAFDVSSMTAFQNRTNGTASKWYASGAGFWRPHKHFVLEKTIIYPDMPTLCDSVVVCDSGVKAYHIYQSFFSPESIRSELEENGFQVEAVLSNLRGEKFNEASPALGVICKKA